MKICSISRLRMWQLRSTRKKIRRSAAPLEGGRSLWEATKKEAFLLNSWSLVFIRQINYFIHCVYWNHSGYVFCCTATLTNFHWFHEYSSLVHGSTIQCLPMPRLLDERARWRLSMSDFWEVSINSPRSKKPVWHRFGENFSYIPTWGDLRKGLSLYTDPQCLEHCQVYLHKQDLKDGKELLAEGDMALLPRILCCCLDDIKWNPNLVSVWFFHLLECHAIGISFFFDKFWPKKPTGGCHPSCPIDCDGVSSHGKKKRPQLC